MNRLKKCLPGFLGILFFMPPVISAMPPQAGLHAWFRADAGVSLSGSDVTEWTDQTTNGFTIIPTAGTPNFVSDALNGLPAVALDGTDQFEGSLGRAILSNATVLTLFEYTVSSSDNDYLYTIGAPGSSGSQMALSRSSGTVAYHYDGSSENYSDVGAIPYNEWLVSSQVFGKDGGDQHDLYLNAAIMLSSEASSDYAVSTSDFVLGNWSSGNYRFVGNVVEILIYDRVLTDADLEDAETYLRERAGLAPFYRSGAADLSSWEIVQYELDAQPDAEWSFDLAGTRADQAVNADASILLSDINVSNKVIWGQFGSGSAPDFMGFVFGYQDRGEFYLFDWKKDTASYLDFGTASSGMRLTAFQIGSGDPQGRDFWASDIGTNTTVLRSNALAWEAGVDYDFSLKFDDGSFSIRVWEGSEVLESWTVTDSMYTSGRFGYFINSLQDVRFGQVLAIEQSDLSISDYALSTDAVRVDWMGGEPPYQVEVASNLTNSWTISSSNLWELSDLVPAIDDQQFYRIRSMGAALSASP